MNCHKVYHKFEKWLFNTFGKDLVRKELVDLGIGKKISVTNYNHFELSKRLIGYEVITKIENYCKRYCKEITIVNCDDDHYASSILLIIPHIEHGITVMFIPQCTYTQNKFFLYQNHYNYLLKALEKHKNVYVK